MDILFIHGNYPAQFRHLCAGFGADSQHRTIFLSARQDAAKDSLPGVEIALFEQHREVNNETHHYLQATEEAVLKGQAVLRSINTLIQQGFNPRLVIFHGGMGLGLFLRDILPKSILIGYFEWWFTAETTKNLVKTFDLNVQLSGGLRNLTTSHEIERCDAGIVPTAWQKQQFPSLLQPKLDIIFDGIDASFFYPPTVDVDKQELVLHNRDSQEVFHFKPKTPILSYATRGMETLRGFPEFMRALPKAMAANNQLEVVIAGADRCAYSYSAPTHKGSWKKHMLNELEGQIDLSKIHFTGLLSYLDYRALLWRSNLHCYFTRPYVTSWSLFEAASCGARLLTNNTEATKGILKLNHINTVDIEDQNMINSQIVNLLDTMHSETNCRSQIIKGYELETSLRKWEKKIESLLLRK